MGDDAGFRRVCLLTGGGDAPGLNAVIRAFVKTAEQLGIEVYGSEDGFEGLIQSGRLVRLKRKSVRGILPKGGSILGCSNRANPFAYPMGGEDGSAQPVDVSEAVMMRLARHGIEALVLAGGDGTMHHAQAFMGLGVPVIGVPKTIDNDLSATDYTFGFDTALSTATWAIDALHSTAESHDRVMIVELMGRYAGWIALCAGIAGGADVVLIPELPYDIERVIGHIRARSERGASFSIVVVGEGARPIAGPRATLEAEREGQLERLGGAGQALADALQGRIGHEVRVTVLGHLQRGGSPSAFDRLLGTRFGVAAAHCCKRGQSGLMLALRGEQIVEVPLDDAVLEPKLVPIDGELMSAARGVGIELGAAHGAAE
ncbi:MAG: 6-phosphofructokinase [Myxococcales bacterium]|nr:6-phosphofructokinase [Myxococcales bacterium]